MAAEKTKVMVKGKTYIVSHDGREVLYVLADNAVMGRKAIHLDGRVARAATRRFYEIFDAKVNTRGMNELYAALAPTER